MILKEEKKKIVIPLPTYLAKMILLVYSLEEKRGIFEERKGEEPIHSHSHPRKVKERPTVGIY